MPAKSKRKKAKGNNKWDRERVLSMGERLTATMRNIARLSAEVEIIKQKAPKVGPIRFRKQDLAHLRRLEELIIRAEKVMNYREADRKRAELAHDATTLTEILSMYNNEECKEYELHELCNSFIEEEKRKRGLWKSTERGKLKRIFSPVKRHRRKSSSLFDAIHPSQISELGGPAKASCALLATRAAMSPENVDTIRKMAKANLDCLPIPRLTTREIMLHFVNAVTGVRNLSPKEIAGTLYRNNGRLEMEHYQDRDHRGSVNGDDVETIRQNLHGLIREEREWYRKMYPEEYEDDHN